MVHGLSCSTACGIFPDQGLNPCPLHWQADSQPLCHQGSPKTLFLIGTHWVFWVATPARSGQQTMRWSQGVWRAQDLAGVGWSWELQGPGPPGPAPLSTPFSKEGRVVAGTRVLTLLPAGPSTCVFPRQCRGNHCGWTVQLLGVRLLQERRVSLVRHSPATRLSWELWPRSFHQKGMLVKAGTIDRCSCTCMTPSQ